MYSAANTRATIWPFQRASWLRESDFSQLLSSASFSFMPMLIYSCHQFCILIRGMNYVICCPSASKVTLGTDVLEIGAVVVRCYISCVCSRYLRLDPISCSIPFHKFNCCCRLLYWKVIPWVLRVAHHSYRLLVLVPLTVAQFHPQLGFSGPKDSLRNNYFFHLNCWQMLVHSEPTE